MIKITGTRSYMEVEIDGKMVKIDGELVEGGFFAEKDSIKKWEIPEGEPIDEETKNNIIKQVTNEAKKSRHMFIKFE